MSALQSNKKFPIGPALLFTALGVWGLSKNVSPESVQSYEQLSHSEHIFRIAEIFNEGTVYQDVHTFVDSEMLRTHTDNDDREYGFKLVSQPGGGYMLNDFQVSTDEKKSSLPLRAIRFDPVAKVDTKLYDMHGVSIHTHPWKVGLSLIENNIGKEVHSGRPVPPSAADMNVICIRSIMNTNPKATISAVVVDSTGYWSYHVKDFGTAPVCKEFRQDFQWRMAITRLQMGVTAADTPKELITATNEYVAFMDIFGITVSYTKR